MAIEQTDGRAAAVYRLNPSDPCTVQKKSNKAHARWTDYRTYANEHEARAAVFRLSRISEMEGER